MRYDHVFLRHLYTYAPVAAKIFHNSPLIVVRSDIFNDIADPDIIDKLLLVESNQIPNDTLDITIPFKQFVIMIDMPNALFGTAVSELKYFYSYVKYEGNHILLFDIIIINQTYKIPISLRAAASVIPSILPNHTWGVSMIKGVALDTPSVKIARKIKQDEELQAGYTQFVLVVANFIASYFNKMKDWGYTQILEQPKKEVKGHKSNKAWKRGDTSHFIYVKPPVARKVNSEIKDTGTSPTPHKRRGHWRRLTNPRYKNHIDYGKAIFIPECTVGDPDKIHHDNTYILTNPEQ